MGTQTLFTALTERMQKIAAEFAIDADALQKLIGAVKETQEEIIFREWEGVAADEEEPVFSDDGYDEDFFAAYSQKLEPRLRKLYSRKKRSVDARDADILATPQMTANAAIVLRDKQQSMQYGLTWEEAVGNFNNNVMLPTGDQSHCDVLVLAEDGSQRTYIQLKNKHNTMNCDQKAQLLYRMRKKKKDEPEATVVWGIINPTKSRKAKGLKQTFTFDDCDHKWEKWHGRYLYDRVFTRNGYNYFPRVLHLIKSLVKEYRM